MSPRQTRVGGLALHRPNLKPEFYSWTFETDLGDIETNTYFWEASTVFGTTAVRSTAYAHAGTYSMRIYPATWGPVETVVDAGGTSMPMPTVKPTSVKVEGWYYMPTANVYGSNPFRARLAIYNDAGTPYGVSADAYTLDAWTKITVDLTSTQIDSFWISNGDYRLHVYGDEVVKNTGMYWDDISVSMS